MTKRSLFGVVLTALLSAGIAVATAAPDSADVIHGCRHNDTGALRVVDADEACGSKETALDWNTMAQPARRWYADRDGDKYGDWYDHLDSVVQPPGYVADNTDCNDDRKDVNPATGVSTGKGQDFDCDGVANEQALRWYRDRDGDGWGNWNDDVTGESTRPNGYVLYANDCNDNNRRVTTECYEPYDNSFDQDRDGHATVGDGDDCNDSNAAMYPGADEIRYDGLDNDCKGQPGSTDTTPDIECYVENVGRHDPDNWGSRLANSSTACNSPAREAPQPPKKKFSPRPSPTPAEPNPKK